MKDRVHGRRQFLRKAGIGLLTFTVGGCAVRMTPAQARREALPYAVLSDDEAATLDALGDVLVPGAAAAGISHFVDHQLGQPYGDQLLMIRYLGVNPPFTPFYRSGLVALDAHARRQHGEAFSSLGKDARRTLVGAMATADPDGWKGPPGPFFYFVTRADAVDVVYGTMEGFDSLGIPYMAHIRPPSRWGS